MTFIEKIDKKYRFAFNSVIMTAYVYVASIIFSQESFYIRVAAGLVLLLVCTWVVHYPNVGISKNGLFNYAMVFLLPSYLMGSTLLALKYYPNLSLAFKLASVPIAVVMFYIVSIVDNIFLVVNQRAETIPLYRAAVPWSQILLVILAIPLFAGVFKIPVYSFYQVGFIALLSTILTLYHIWSYRLEDNLVPIGVGGNILFSLFTGFVVFSLGISTSFTSGEAFLRGLVVSVGLMFGLFYASSYLKNNINKKLIVEYFAIIFGFIALYLLFQ